MNDHSVTVVPLETWAYHAPRLARDGIHADVGGLAEALIYYDRILVNVQHPHELEALVARFAREGAGDLLIRLFEEGTLRPYHFAFHSATILRPDGVREAWNVQGKDQAEPRWFGRGLLSKASLKGVLSPIQRKRLLSLLEDRVIELKASDFAGVIKGALDDVHDPAGSVLLVQALMDDVYDLVGLSRPPEVSSKIERRGDLFRVTWNVDLRGIGKALGEDVDDGAPAQASIITTRHLWAAVREGADLFLGSPLSRIAGAKLYEAASRAAGPHAIIERLVEEVEFPDVRELVNHEGLPLAAVMKLREKGGRFRAWLQTEAERDRDAIIAYHNEVAKEAGWLKAARHTLSILSTAGGSLVGGLTTAAATGSPELAVLLGGLAGQAAKKGVEHLSRAGQDWRPVMFGKVALKTIEKYLRGRSRK